MLTGLKPKRKTSYDERYPSPSKYLKTPSINRKTQLQKFHTPMTLISPQCPTAYFEKLSFSSSKMNQGFIQQDLYIILPVALDLKLLDLQFSLMRILEILCIHVNEQL